jgi:hypothetical protein
LNFIVGDKSSETTKELFRHFTFYLTLDIMFERYITDALTTHFGHIVESVDADKMQLSAWKGELELHDVTLKTHALDNILKQPCPVEIAFGHIELFQVKIPWSLLSAQFLNWQKNTSSESRLLESSACSIVLSDVNILVTPRRNVHQEQDEEDKKDRAQGENHADTKLRRRADKERQVQSLLDANLLKRVTESSVSSSRWTWLQNWISSLLSTLSVTIRNIHIRYEDPGTSMGFQWKVHLKEYSGINSPPRLFPKQQRFRPAFAVGITLKEFSVQSVVDSSAKNAVIGLVTRRDNVRKTTKDQDDDTVVTTTKNDATSVSSNVSASTKVTETIDSPARQQQPQTLRSSFIKRYKLAAAEHLAIYWDSDSHLITMNATRSDTVSRPSTLRMYREAFTVLNDGEETQLPPTPVSYEQYQHLHRDRHSYLLEPISPSVHLMLVPRPNDTASQHLDDEQKVKTQTLDSTSLCDTAENFSQNRQDQLQQDYPPSSIQLDLPPCKFTFARNTLQDCVYLRKSLSVWTDAAKTLLSEKTLRRLARLRPMKSPFEDPKSWWIYAFEATKVLVRVEQQHRYGVDNTVERRTGNDVSQDDSTRDGLLMRRKGWFGLVQAVSRRREYVRLYASLIEASKTHNASTEANTHQALLDMEDELLPEEIVSFRIYVYETFSSKAEALGADAVDGALPCTTNRQDSESSNGESDEEILSVRHRRWMMNEMKSALDRERANKESQAAEKDMMSPQYKNNPIVWTSSLVCRELAIQINDQVSSHSHSVKFKSSTPVVRMSSAIVQDQCWNEDGSWISTWSIASLEVKDLISSKGPASIPSHFSTLLGKKTGPSTSNIDEYIIIDGIRYHRSISVTVNKRLHWPSDRRGDREKNFDRGSTTTTQVRILPMEVVYSTLPVEAVSRIVATVRTPEIVDDYHKILAAANNWREEQKRKLIDALAHKNKKIIVDIDVAAPELLIPENIHRSNSPVLSIDLGRIQAFNDDDVSNGDTPGTYDDQWRLIISNMQVQCTSVSGYISAAKPGSERGPIGVLSPQQLVEAFSIDFVVSTKISSSGRSKSGGASKIHVSGMLPRLAFNLTSSAIRLVARLQERWRSRKKETENFVIPNTATATGFPDGNAKQLNNNNAAISNNIKTKTEQNGETARILIFEFSAPLITFKLEDDSFARENRPIVPLFDLAIGGISGRFLYDADQIGNRTTRFNASLQTLGVIDLFQSAGKDFVLLMSSVPQVALIDVIVDEHSYSWDAVRNEYDPEDKASRRTALVVIEYLCESTSMLDDNGQRVSDPKPRLLSIWFHELYVEWNPETIAVIQRAIAIPFETEALNIQAVTQKSPDGGDSCDSDDEFFDAMEELKEHGSERGSVRSLSEISTSSDQIAMESSTRRSSIGSGFVGDGRPSPGRLSFSSIPGSPFTSGLSYFDTMALASLSNLESKENRSTTQVIKIVFELSKLRVSFNKETRHRKLMIAQMDRTFVSYSTRTSGGSNTTLRIGNLVFIDPVHEQNGTLYGHILGLKNDSGEKSQDPSSLLEMDIILNPKTRQFSSMLNGTVSDTVTIDRHKGVMTGCDCGVSATLSPMRFVLIQQLWLEIIDYFFQGVIGSEVIGGDETLPIRDRVTTQTSSIHNSAFLTGSEAEGISFTRFKITLVSPVILLPVTYASPEFVRLELSKISMSNEFWGVVISDEAYGTVNSPADRMQWFNHCDVTLEELRLFSWSGPELGKEPASGRVQLRWPSGPFSHLILPKWDVSCIFDELDISSRRSDYALLQNIISYNIGEESRYMNEWNALQNLSASALEEYMQKIVVHYGYDKKDVAPSTYQLSVSIASLKFSVIDGQKSSSPPLATARCFDLSFDMKKDADLIVKQNLSCDIDLIAPQHNSPHFDKLLSMSKHDHGVNTLDNLQSEEKPGLTYSSVTHPSKDSVRFVEIVDASIYMIIPKWRRLISFFQSLPPPILLDKNDIGASIQVGDRWYRIGDGGASPLAANGPSMHNPDVERLSWIDNASSTNILLATGRSSSRISAFQRSDAPTSQTRLLLTWPRIVVSSKLTEGAQTRVILRMHHSEFLQINVGKSCTLEKSLLLHDVEVYTASDHLPTESSKAQKKNSLIHPWSIALSISTCNGESIGDCDTHEFKLSADVLRARAAYSDMAIATDVILSVLHSAKEEARSGNEDLLLEPVFTAGSYDSLNSRPVYSGRDGDVMDDLYCKTPSTVAYDLQCDGFQLQVADDR